jgi:DNA-3-methyladenine glycosylase I
MEAGLNRESPFFSGGRALKVRLSTMLNSDEAQRVRIFSGAQIKHGVASLFLSGEGLSTARRIVHLRLGHTIQSVGVQTLVTFILAGALQTFSGQCYLLEMTSPTPNIDPIDEGLIAADDGRPRCFWAGSVPGFETYHDTEWGFPVDDDHVLFEKICLEGFQAGLSWRTILNKRPAFREVFLNFDFERVAGFGDAEVEGLLGDARIVRHRGKIEATINNARRACEAVEVHGSLGALIWRYEPSPEDRPRRLTRDALMSMSKTPGSARLAKDLKKLGWRFFGPTTAYAFMQAMGLVNDHVEGCVVRAECERRRAQFLRPV